MGVPYETKPVVVDVPGGQTKTVRLNFPARALISKLIVTQMTGALDDYTVEMFNHADAMEATEQSASSSDADGQRLPLDVYRVGNPKVGVAGKLAYFSDETTGGAGLQFYCQDEENPQRRGQVQRNLYVRISPGGTGSKSFAVCVGGDSQVG